ncbi:MAG: hypothetical protein CL431_02360 [Acidimicrobiaceae bacterium]|jgi:hypothetical protein|nr:hypothetical protein [Acidimicrobiaceae bacterium]|tara:strand:+ start:4910 stop:5269 length:360 start_codon:yes stop_codon:yes gene_type:complete
MKLSLFLKDTHMTVIEKLKEKHSGTSDEDIIKKCVKSAIELEDDDLIFGSAREQCGGGCFASEPQFEVVLDEDDFTKLKSIYQNQSYEFEEYDSEEEEISKTIRCILNFVDYQPDALSL